MPNASAITTIINGRPWESRVRAQAAVATEEIVSMRRDGWLANAIQKASAMTEVVRPKDSLNASTHHRAKRGCAAMEATSADAAQASQRDDSTRNKVVHRSAAATA